MLPIETSLTRYAQSSGNTMDYPSRETGHYIGHCAFCVDPHQHPMPYKSKTLATWAALIGGPLGLHRFYLHGWRDAWAWLFPIPTLLGLWGIQRVNELGQDDHLAWLLVPLLGMAVATAMLQGILIGLTPDEKWHQRFNPQVAGSAQAPAAGWPVVIGVVISLMVGATVLMATIAFSGQRYFEYQVEEAQKLSQ
jgi:hypothetical protein